MDKGIVPCSKAVSLAESLSKELGLDIVDYESRTFPDGELYFRVDSKVKEAIIVQGGYPGPNNSVMEILLACNAVKANGCKKITCVLPYMPYVRQDKRFKPGEAFSLEVISTALKGAGVSKLITADAHYRKDYGKGNLFGLDAVNISGGGIIANHAKEKLKLDSLFIISPDFGASEMVKLAAKDSKSEFGTLKKKRSGDYTVELEGDLDIKGKNVLVLDDIISTGRTMIAVIEKCRDSGAEKIIAGATHGLFVHESLETLRGLVDYMVTSDSIDNGVPNVSLAPAIAKVLK